MLIPDYGKKPPGGLAGFFTIYKPGLGKYVRWGTVGGLGLVILSGAYWLSQDVLAVQDPIVRSISAAVWVAGLGLLTFWFVNSPGSAEFLIMTESEMRKVSWPSRREVINSTKVVILLTALMGLILWAVDVGFLNFFRFIRIE